MRAGTLIKTVVISRYIETDNEYGEPIKSWVDLYEIRASVKQLNGTEKYLSNEKVALSTHQVGIRHLDVTTKDKLVYKGINFDITSVIDVEEQGRELIILCKELLNG